MRLALASIVLLACATCGGAPDVPVVERATLIELRFEGGEFDRHLVGGRRIGGFRASIRDALSTTRSHVVPAGGARVEGWFAVQPRTREFWPGEVVGWLDGLLEDGSRKRLQRFRVSVPHLRWQNGWHRISAELPEEWAGRPVRFVFSTDYVIQHQKDREVDYYLGAAMLRLDGPRDLERRDVIVVTLDTLRADVLGAYGTEAARTPVFDALAAEGALFEQAYATANATTPSHCSLFTSLFLKDHEVYNNDLTISQAASTMAECFRAAGYETHALTSVRMLPHLSGLEQGFVTCNGPPKYMRDGKLTVKDLTEVLPAKAGPPLFCWIHLFDPHTDDPFTEPYLYNPSGEYAAHFPGASGERGDPLAERARYRAEVSYTDNLLGRVLAALDERGYDSRRLVVVTSDHGESLGEHGIDFRHETLYSVVTRVPLVFHGDGIPRGFRTDELVSLVDVMPTVLELAGVEPPPVMFGRNLEPIWSRHEPGRDVVYFEEVHRKSVGLRTPEWKYTRFLKDSERAGVNHPEGSELLFRLTDDPAEDVNLAASERERCAEFSAQVDRFLEARLGGLDSIQGELSDELRRELEAMGYTVSGD